MSVTGRIIVADTPAGGKRFGSNWRYCVGSGHMGLALRQEHQDALALVQREIGFSYIRGHGLLSDAVGLYREKYWNHADDLQARPGLNFTYVDLIYDSFLAQGIRPFVELGFMPDDLASGDQACFWWRGNITPPSDYGRWREMIRGLVSHLIARYGVDEVKRWPFEVWNEPDVKGFWTGGQEEYFRLYRETARAIKDVNPDLQIGGPATCPAHINWITRFLEMCDREGVPVDFISTHSYAGAKVTRAAEYAYQSLHLSRPRDSLDTRLRWVE